MSRPPALTAAAFAVLALIAGCTSDTTADGPPGRDPGALASAMSTAETAPSGTAPGAGATRTADPTGTTDETGTTDKTGTTDSVRPVGIPANTTLRPSDWPGGIRREGATGVTALAQTEPSACQDTTAYPSDRHRLAGRTIGISSDEPESGGMHEQIVRYAPGRAVQALAEMRRALAACHSYRTGQVSPRAVRTYRLEAQRFAGDDALLVRRSDRVDGAGPREWSDYITIVRIGDAVVTTISEQGEGTADRAIALRLATVAAARAACLRDRC